jgi:hypothetical protein
LRSLSDPSAVRNVILRDGQAEQNLTAVGPREFAIDLPAAGTPLPGAPTTVTRRVLRFAVPIASGVFAALKR